MIGAKNAALDVEGVALEFFRVGAVTLLAESGAQVAHGLQRVGILQTQ